MCLFTNCSSYSACIMVLPLYPSDPSQLRKVTVCSRHVIASVWDIKITEALLTLCFAYYAMKWVWHCWKWGIMSFTYRDMGCAFHDHILCVFRTGWMDCVDNFHAVLCSYCCVTDRKYEVYWLISVPIINPWGVRQPFFLVKRYAQINQLKLIFDQNK